MKNKKRIVTIILICLFIINSILVTCNLTTNIDNKIHDYIYFQNDIFNNIMLFFTFLGSTLFIIIASIIFVLFLILKNNKKYIYVYISLILTSTALNNIIKIIIRRARPEYITVVENTYSFPSGHTMASTTFYGFLIYFILKSNLNKKLKVLLISVLSCLIFFIITSRIYLGAHYFFDCLSGFILSISLILITTFIIEKK